MTNAINDIKKIIAKGKCTDQFVGTLEQIEKIFPNREKFPNRENILYSESKVILILESPHIEEFKTTPAIPANGRTGSGIMKYIIPLVKCCLKLMQRENKFEEFKKRKLCLINAIPYQCSNGENLQEYKNKTARGNTFKELWNSSQYLGKTGKEAFQENLEKIYKSGDIIINCCTDELKNLVQEAINEIITDKNVKFISMHPVSWILNPKVNCYVYKTDTGTLFPQNQKKFFHSCECENPS